MSNTNDITENFGTLYFPKAALVFYENKTEENAVYVEHFDMDRNGNPVNAHPLNVKEATMLAKSLQTDKEHHQAFLKPKGILPTTVLHINPSDKGSVLWYTKAQQRQLYFVDTLNIPNGKANVPPMLWLAGKTGLSVFALAGNQRPTENTALYHAPFFNVYDTGNVCMGTVDVNIRKSSSVEEFIQAWENYFFNSYLSHLMGGHNPVTGNCVSLWKHLIGSGTSFPKEVLKKNNKTLDDLL